jgi:nicotinamide riboside kinase
MIRIAVTGPESTGKSSLVSQLAQHYGCPFVPEYAREYLTNLNRPYNALDVETIARKQMELEDSISSNSKIIFYDTDLLVCRIWMEVVFGACPDWLIAESRKQPYSHTLLMNIDLPWEPDPLREHPHLREEIFTRYRTALIEDERPFTIISGMNEDRFENAKNAIDKLHTLLF